MDLYQVAKESIASQDKFELWQLLVLLDHFGPARILEIGVHRGGMVQTLRQVFPHAIVVGIDTDYQYLEYSDFNAVTGDSTDPEIRDDAAGYFGRHGIDFLFIDGDHHYEAAKKDFEMYAPLVKSGGIVAFHDIMRDPARVPHHEGVEVRRLFDELKLKHASMEIWNGTAGDDGPGIGVLFL